MDYRIYVQAYRLGTYLRALVALSEPVEPMGVLNGLYKQGDILFVNTDKQERWYLGPCLIIQVRPVNAPEAQTAFFSIAGLAIQTKTFTSFEDAFLSPNSDKTGPLIFKALRNYQAAELAIDARRLLAGDRSVASFLNPAPSKGATSEKTTILVKKVRGLEQFQVSVQANYPKSLATVDAGEADLKMDLF